MDFLWFWVSMGLMVEATRRSVRYFYPKTPIKTNSDLASLKESLLTRGDMLTKSTCPYGCCSNEILNEILNEIPAYGTDTEESPRSTESTDEIVSLDEIEEDEESLVVNRGKGKQMIQDHDGMQEIVGSVYPSGISGHPKLVRFKVSDKSFQVSNTGGARLAKEGSAKIHPQPNGTADQAHSSIRNSSSHSSEDKHGVPSEETASDEIRSSEGQCSYKEY